MHRRRDHGGLVFIDLRDRSGLVQLVFHPGARRPRAASAHELRTEAVLSVAGHGRRARPRERQPEPPHRRDRDRSVASSTCWPSAETPPFPIDEDVAVDELLRLRHRPLDLRREPMRDALILRHERRRDDPPTCSTSTTSSRSRRRS